MAKPSPYTGRVNALSDDEFELLRDAVRERRRRDDMGIGTHEACKADVNDPVYLECMSMANNLCSWLKRYLWRFTGMDPDNLQPHLNWYVYLFRVNQAQEKWPRTERVVRHLMMADAHYRSLGAFRSTQVLDC